MQNIADAAGVSHQYALSLLPQPPRADQQYRAGTRRALRRPARNRPARIIRQLDWRGRPDGGVRSHPRRNDATRPLFGDRDRGGGEPTATTSTRSCSGSASHISMTSKPDRTSPSFATSCLRPTPSSLGSDSDSHPPRRRRVIKRGVQALIDAIAERGPRQRPMGRTTHDDGYQRADRRCSSRWRRRAHHWR